MTTPVTRPLVSVVVPTYNRRELLRRSLSALADQRFPGEQFEVVVADDGSADGTREMVETFADRLRIRYHFQPDEGWRVATARNAGARLATAGVLAFIDSGTLVGPDYVRALRDIQVAADGAARTGRATIGYAYGYDPDRDGTDLRRLLAEQRPADVVAHVAGEAQFRDMRHDDFAGVGFDLTRLRAPWMLFWGLNVCVSAADFWAVGGFAEEFNGWGVEDLELGFRLMRHGVRFELSREAWAVEWPHERDEAYNEACSLANAQRFLRRNPSPDVEMFVAIDRRGELASLEPECRTLDAWREQARNLDVADELRAATSDLDGSSRIAVFGAGPAVPPTLPAPATLFDPDADALAKATADGVHAAVPGIGAATSYPDGHFDVVVVTSRLAGLWARWGGEVVSEARRVGRQVRLPAGW
jgi:validoxylamine A glucosyltransferase